MTTLREAAQQALEALEAALSDDQPYIERCKQTITALRSALAELPQEPVAWRTFSGEGGYDYRAYEDNEDYAKQWNARNQRHVGWVEPLYLAPPQRKPLTEEELRDTLRQCPHDTVENLRVRWLYAKDFARAIEAAHGIKENT